MVLLERLAQRKQHAEELAVLNDLARRLASLRDPGEVLKEVAAQARRLLRTDIAYISLIDNDVLRIEVVNGSMGHALRGIELRPGQGLAGAVLVSGKPVSSESYLADQSLTHDTNVDEAAQSEQLGGILAVPLIVAEETIGVLLAADRQTRKFGAQEIQLLAALAAHAAVALRNAKLFEQYQRANRELQDTLASRQRSTKLREALTAAVLAGDGIDALLNLLIETLDAQVRYMPADEAAATEYLYELTGTRSGEDLFPPGAPGTYRTTAAHGNALVAQVAVHGGHVGCLAAVGDTSFSDEADRLLTTGATAVALIVASERSVAEADRRLRGELVASLLSPTVDEAAVRRRARDSGLALDDIRNVVVLQPDGDSSLTHIAGTCTHLVERNGWSAPHEGRLVLFLADDDTTAVTAKVRALHLPGSAGVAPSNTGLQGLRAAYEAARQTATMLLALGRRHDCRQASELGAYRSLFGQSGRDEVRNFVTATIGPLLDHDRDKDRKLTATLDVYLQQAQHHARTCSLLHIHPNTLYQRLDRVTSLLGPDWRDPNRVLEIQLALKMQDLLTKLDNTSH